MFMLFFLYLTEIVSVQSASIIDPCTGNECHKGSECVTSPFGTGYTCRCQTGWQGRYCEKGKARKFPIKLIIKLLCSFFFKPKKKNCLSYAMYFY